MTISRAAIGSVIEKVARAAPCPVLSGHQPEHEVVRMTPTMRWPAGGRA